METTALDANDFKSESFWNCFPSNAATIQMSIWSVTKTAADAASAGTPTDYFLNVWQFRLSQDSSGTVRFSPNTALPNFEYQASIAFTGTKQSIYPYSGLPVLSTQFVTFPQLFTWPESFGCDPTGADATKRCPFGCDDDGAGSIGFAGDYLCD